MACVYVHFRENTNEPFYVGIGKNKARAYKLNHHSRTKWHKNIVKKHGVSISIVADDIDWNLACFWEIRWIKALKNSGYELVNLTDGGEGPLGRKHSPATIAKMKKR